MNTCDTCMHWSRHTYGKRIRGQCCNDKLDDGEGIDTLQGGEPAECTVITSGEKFGCIHWEKNP